mmetsp:Transcript_18439/g.60296  ORF Transcript_18439/g.60296 Transcript_18439/m.60296 type:complete len:206 (+) Transcript_18439:463-1080(+)
MPSAQVGEPPAAWRSAVIGDGPPGAQPTTPCAPARFLFVASGARPARLPATNAQKFLRACAHVALHRQLQPWPQARLPPPSTPIRLPPPSPQPAQSQPRQAVGAPRHSRPAAAAGGARLGVPGQPASPGTLGGRLAPPRVRETSRSDGGRSVALRGDRTVTRGCRAAARRWRAPGCRAQSRTAGEDTAPVPAGGGPYWRARILAG